ncbi:MAG: MFS transporter [bacterium]
MRHHSRIFHLFLGVHSLLIGIFPFFIPVYLWKEGYVLGAVSIFIAIGGLGFCLGLWAWDRLRARIDLTSMIALSLLLEALLLLNVYALDLDMTLPALLSLGLCYGVYNCFFWTTQRALFFEIIEPSNSGRKYGNFQIFVGALLQAGILLGGLLLERDDFFYIIVLSAMLALGGFMLLLANAPEYPDTLRRTDALRLREIIGFKDGDASRTIFAIDGFYLFLESFFWVISLFLIAHESFTKLGIVVLSLAVIFGILFYLLKNIIDRLGRKRVYQLAVALYALSWALRAITDGRASLELLFILLVSITFATSMFRLVMNKRFYDIAKHTASHRYLLLKSYYSQASIFVLYLLFGWAVLPAADGAELLAPVYWAAAAIAPIYLLYGAKRYR